MKQTTRLCVGAVAYALTAISASSQTIAAKLTRIDPSISVKGTFNGGSTISNYTSGVNQFTSTSYGGFDFEAFCVQPDATVVVGQTLNYEVTDTSELTNSDKIAKVIGGFLASSQNAAEAAATQWAIWELTYESSSSKNLTDGKVKIYSPSTSTSTRGNEYLAQLDTFEAADIVFLTNSKYQNMIGWKPGTVIPEPSSLALLALSTGLLLRRKRK